MASARHLLLAVALAACLSAVCGIKCWVCRSDTDPKCADPFDNTTMPITDCKEERELPHLPNVKATMCRKTRQKVNGEWRYIRSCAYMGEPGIKGDERFCLMRTGTYNIFLEYCTCSSKDGCNSAPSLKSLNVINVTLPAIVVFIFLRFARNCF